MHLTPIAVLVGLSTSGCGGAGDEGGHAPESPAESNIIRVTGSDTMVNLAQAWAEDYQGDHPEISIQVAGGGSGVGIAGLIDGIVDMANASRKMKSTELKRAEQALGMSAVEHVVGLDALAVYVHKDNPLESIAIPELAEIYGEGGETTLWAQIGGSSAACSRDEIVRISRQNNSGTYVYFRRAVLGAGREYKLGSIDQSGSKDVVALVSKTPCAIGYSGMAYATPEVKSLPVAAEKGAEAITPTTETAASGDYPISRPLLIYTAGEPTGAIRDYLDWIYSPAGQRIVAEIGYVPIKAVE
ncbi:MAG: phosphate-binding protein [Gemmatimonadetes bacterium]|nr:phosphate-binding protein [Gemmatimonadota bacterium]